MVKTLYLVRHGQGYHNISPIQPQGNPNVKDPHLTPTGVSQCLALRAAFTHHPTINLVLASPLRRAIQTAVIGLAPALARPEVPLVLVPRAQEISAKPSDTGTDPAALKAVLGELLGDESFEGFEAGRVDLGGVEESWNSKAGEYEASLDATVKRAAALRCWLWARPEENVVLVTHGAFLHYLTEDWTGLELPRGTAWKTCEFRRYTFDEASNEKEAHMTEIGKVDGKGTRPVGAHSRDISGTEVLPN